MSDKNALLVSVIVVTYNRKDETIECIDSVLRSSYAPIEVIVVDNASTDGTCEALSEKYSGKIKLVKSQKNLYAGGGRNLGARHAKGDLFLFVDSDNVIDVTMIETMMKGVEENKELKIGIAGPFTYYKCDRKRLCWVNSSISLITSRTRFEGISEMDNGRYETRKYIKVGHIPNCFMLKKDVFNSVGGIDSDYIMHYEESDLAEKVIRSGLDVVLFPKARTWHNLPLISPKGHKSFGGDNRKMVYYVTRNRIVFMRKNSSGLGLFAFLLVFNNCFLVYHFLILAMNKQLNLSGFLFKGYFDGLFNKLNK